MSSCDRGSDRRSHLQEQLTELQTVDPSGETPDKLLAFLPGVAMLNEGVEQRAHEGELGVLKVFLLPPIEGDAEDSVVLPELLLQLTGQTGLPAAPIAEQADGGRQQIRGLDDLIDRCGEMGNTEEVKFGFVIGPHGFSVPQSVMAYVHITYAAVQLR